MNLVMLINDAGAIVISICFALLIAGLTYLLYRSWHKEQERIEQEKANYIDGLKTKLDVETNINNYISMYGSAGTFTLLQIEVDGLGDVQSAFGAKESDNLIIKTAYKIMDILPGGSDLTRLNEGTFLAFVKNINDQGKIFELCNDIIGVIEQPLTLMGHASIVLSSNIGIIMYPVHAAAPKELFKNVALATHVAKRQGINQFAVYSDVPEGEVAGGLEFYQQILDGIKNNQFCLYYQPIMNSKENSIESFEALLRWNHPTLGLISPNKFMNVLEQSGDIKVLGLWSLESMIKSYIEINKTYPSTTIRMHLNLSPKQLTDEMLIGEINRIIKKYKAIPSNIVFEVLEYAIYDNHPVLSSNLKKLKDMGFGIATDNYGVDYGLLNKIQSMPIDMIKLDRKFLLDEESSINNQLIELLMKVCKDSGKTVIAMGVEDEEMLKKINEFGIDLIQGYYYSAPIPADKLVEYITKYEL